MLYVLKTNLLRKANRKGGFSLIEILIVIALIAVIAGLAISNLGGIFGGQQEKAAQIFVSQSLKSFMCRNSKLSKFERNLGE